MHAMLIFLVVATSISAFFVWNEGLLEVRTVYNDDECRLHYRNDVNHIFSANLLYMVINSYHLIYIYIYICI